MNPRNASCPVCAATGELHLQVSQYSLYRCGDCRLSFCSPLPTDDELAAYYALYHLDATQGGVYDSVESRMRADFPAKLKVVRGLQQPRRLLDVGCGKGFFVSYCNEQGIEAEGIDLSSSAIDFAKRNLRGQFHQGLLADAPSSMGRFDAITMWATIEHVKDPLNLLRDVHARLEPGGYLHLDTGIGYDWLDRWIPGNVQWYDPPQHLYVFSERSLKMACEAVGFRVERFTGCFERNRTRGVLRNVRNMTAVASLCLCAPWLGGRPAMKRMTRLPIGNLQSFSVRKT